MGVERSPRGWVHLRDVGSPSWSCETTWLPRRVCTRRPSTRVAGTSTRPFRSCTSLNLSRHPDRNRPLFGFHRARLHARPRGGRTRVRNTRLLARFARSGLMAQRRAGVAHVSVGLVVRLLNPRRDAPALGHLHALLPRPHTHGTELSSVATSASTAPARSPATGLAANLDVTLETVPKRLGVPFRQVDLVVPSVETEAHGLSCLGPVEVVREHNDGPSCHLALPVMKSSREGYLYR